MTGPLVVKIGGAGVDEPLKTPALWKALASTFRSLAGQLVLVHGGGRAVDAHLDRLGFSTHRVQELRVTPDDQIEEVVGVLAGRVNKAIVGALHAQSGDPDLRAVGLCLSDGRLSHVKRRMAPGGQDLGRVGSVVSDRDDYPGHLLRVLTSNGFLPVLCSIGYDSGGRPLNVNADDAAAEIAYRIGARGLVLLTDVEGILGADGKRTERIDGRGIERLISQGVIRGGMMPKARAAVSAAKASGAPTIIASFNRPGDLVRIARREAAGTVVVQ